MNAVIPVELPRELRDTLANEKGEASLPRWTLEAIVAEAVRQGLITEGFAGHVLGLSFDERERFLAEYRIVHDYTGEELRAQRKTIESAIRNR